MRRLICLFVFLLPVMASSQNREADKAPKSSNIRQYYSGKFGFYQPSDGLNNGLLFGVDGITEFIHYDFFLSGGIDLYMKQTIGIFKNAPPSGYSQSMILLPLNVNVAYKVFEVADADSRGYVCGGLGYYLYFFNADYQSGAGGLFGSLGLQSDSKSGGNLFGSVFFRVLIGQIFVEPRFYIAAKKEDSLNGGYQYVVNPSGFAVTLGFQYH